jgi:general secretion pathway protein L
MTETLFVRLAARDGAPPSWLVVDAAGNPAGPPMHGALSSAAQQAAGRRVVVLAPGTEVLLAEPQLPVRGGARLAQVVPFALEEHLAQDVEELHFAIGRRAADRPGTPVAAVARAGMDQWLAAIHAAGLQPQALYAEHALLPSNPSHSVLLIEKERVFVRHPGQPPLALDVAPLQLALELTGLLSTRQPAMDDTVDLADEPTPGRDAPQPAHHVIAYLTEEDWNTHQAVLESARETLASLNVQLLPDGALPLLAAQTPQPACNLLQGAYATKSGFAGAWQRWRLAATLLVCLIGLNLAGKGAELWRLQQTERNVDAAIEQTFREAMPGENNATSARRRMEARLAAVRGSAAGGEGGILRMLGALGSAFPQIPGARLHALSFRNNVLDLRVEAGDVGALSRLESLVGSDGLTARLQSSSSSAGGVEGKVQVSAGGEQ